MNHELRISSTAPFFNNKADGQSFGKDFSKNRLSENTVALDTWLTLGQVTKSSAVTFFGVPKASDDGSIVGGVNNDGGSAVVTSGLLINNDATAGIPLTIADGNDTLTVVPSNWAHSGIVSTAGDDSTIFGSVIAGQEFVSRSASLQNTGVAGVVPNLNEVLVAQLTTMGEIEFEINLEITEERNYY